MREVSCRALGVVLKAAKRRGVPDAVLTAGLDRDVAYLRNTSNWIEWIAFCRVLSNVRATWSLEDLSDLNESFMRSPFFSSVGVIARLLFTARDLFAWTQKRVGGGAQLFSTCVKPAHEHIGADCTVIRLEIQPPHAVSEEFFWMTRGAFIGMPRLVGAGNADVQMKIEGRTATYTVRYKNKRGTLSSLIRLLRWPFTVRSAARELQSANEELHARFYELEDARGKLDRQATQLRTAHTVSSLVHRDLDLDRTLDTITKALVEAGFMWAEIRIVEGDRVARFGVESAVPLLYRTLQGRGGQPLGEISVAPKRDAERGEREELLAFIVPNLALALENSIYRTGLERLVDQRTTELRQARDELAETVHQLREAQGARERFFGNISHEIRTPLSIIMLAVADVESRAGALLDERARAGLGVVTDSARKLVRLVDELLLLASGQEGKLRIQPEPTELCALIAHLLSAWRPAAETAGLELSVRAPASLLANIDPVAIERVATNLVSNAIKYTPRGGRVELELADEPGGLRFSVLDTGEGIDDELAGRLFGRFERAAGDHRRVQGTGLGLSLAKQLVEAHGGTISVVARATGGSELRVVLPVEVVQRGAVGAAPHPLDEDVPPQVAPAPVAPAPGMRFAPAGLSSGTIVIAEDDVRLAEMLARMLADEYTVVVAHDGHAALDLVRQHQPQLLVTDVDMPGMTGIELARRFRATTKDHLAPIIILSAMLDLGTRVEGLEAGALDYIAKPFDPVELKARVRAQFRMRELAQRLHRAEQLSALAILTSGLAHELRNPANGVVNAIGPLIALLPAELTRPDEPVGQLLEVIGGCAEQIAALSRQLLGFRGTAQDLELRPVGIGELVKRAISLARASLAGIEMRTDLELAGTLNCAPHLMTQVLTNLIENAGHAAGRGGWVEIRGRVEAGQLTLEVADSGQGVPLELRDRIFEPFFTTKAPGAGTGLGLSLARDIVHRHGGVLEVRDRGPRPVFVMQVPGHSRLDDLAGAM